jgi:hypothetical protein
MIEIIYSDLEKTISNDKKTVNLFDLTGPLSVEETSFSFIKHLERQIVDKRTVEDFYTYDEIPLYFFVRPTFYGKLKNIIFFIELLEKVTSDKHDNYFLKTDDKVLFIIARDLFEIKVEMINTGIIKNKYFNFKPYFNAAKRYAKGISGLLKFRFNGKKPRTLAITHSADINLVNNKKIKGYRDTQLGNVINKLKSKYSILELQLLNNENQVEKSLKYENSYIPFECFVLYKKLSGRKAINEVKIQDYSKYFHNLDYNYKQYNLRSIILENIINSFQKECLNYLSEILAAEKFIRKLKFEKCIIAGEGDRGRCFVVASRRAGVPCYSVQHGIINDTSPNYIINSNYDLVPTLSFLWGKRYQHILLKNTNNYNDHNTAIVGQARTDLLKQYHNEANQPHNTVRILYATQYLKDLLEPATEMLFKALNLLNVNYELVIKLHPADNYIEIYNQLIKLYNIRNVRIVKDEDLYNLISWCDIIVSVHSTVVLEGALMEKPSVCIILPKYNDEGGFVKDGVSLGAADECQLAKYISAKNLDYLEAFKFYIEDNFYAIDGNVADRIVKEINN